MSNIIKKINKEIAKISNIAESEDGNKTYRAIAMYLMSLWRKNKPLDKISVLSTTLNVSVSSISKFLTSGDIVNYQVLKYFYQINSEEVMTESTMSSQLMEVSKSISKSRRILLVATGNTSMIAKVFYTNLILNGFNAVFLEGSIDQVKIAKKMTEEDTTLILSFSMRHAWMKDIYKKSNSNTILFTSNPMVVAKNNKVVIRIDREKLTNGTREDFSQTIHLQKHLDTVIKDLIKLKV